MIAIHNKPPGPGRGIAQNAEIPRVPGGKEIFRPENVIYILGRTAQKCGSGRRVKTRRSGRRCPPLFAGQRTGPTKESYFEIGRGIRPILEFKRISAIYRGKGGGGQSAAKKPAVRLCFRAQQRKDVSRRDSPFQTCEKVRQDRQPPVYRLEKDWKFSYAFRKEEFSCRFTDKLAKRSCI